MTEGAVTDRWGGGVSPYAVSWQKLMMWLFLVNDAILFASLLAAYGFNRLAAGEWPVRAEIFHISFIAAMTFVLITSSATMASAVAAARARDRAATARFLLLTIGGGLVFLGMQAYEWTSIIGEGARLHANPWGVPGFSSFFFVITGFHGTHVFLGTVILAVVAFRAIGGRASPEGVELAGLYWHFVDLVWVFVFGCFYLL